MENTEKKPFIVAYLRDLEKQVSLGEISYSKMVEELNKKAAEFYQKETISREALMEKIQEIQDTNYNKFMGSNEAELHTREEVADLFERHSVNLSELQKYKDLHYSETTRADLLQEDNEDLKMANSILKQNSKNRESDAIEFAKYCIEACGFFDPFFLKDYNELYDKFQKEKNK